MEKASKKKETRIKMETVNVLQQTSYRRHRDDEYLALTLYLLAKITLTLMSSFAMPVVSENSIFRNLTYVLDADGNFDLPSAFLYALCEFLEE